VVLWSGEWGDLQKELEVGGQGARVEGWVDEWVYGVVRGGDLQKELDVGGNRG